VIAGGALMALELRAYTAGAVCRLAAAIGHACRLAAADAASRHRAWLAGAVERVLALSPACVTGPAGSMPSACRVGIEPLNEVQVMAVEVLLLLLLFALPLWMAQHRARTLHIAQLSQAALASDLKACASADRTTLPVQHAGQYALSGAPRPRARHRHADHLIAYLRSALPDLRSPMSTLGRECELAGHYLALMAIRYGERLQIRIDCDEVQGLALPPLLLMLLVETPCSMALSMAK
jgi:hypothetical protein